jgi:hypothetical protein
MRFMLLCYDDERAWADAGDGAMQTAMAEAIRLAHDLHARGQYHLAAPLEPAATARTIRLRQGQRVVTDGPFAETREVLGGFYLIDADSIEEALEVAARHPGARFGSVEVRPIMEIEGLPPAR